MKTLFVTDIGSVRSHNEDAGGIFTNKAGEYLAVVADGMGGHQAGDVASQMVVDMLEQTWKPIDEPFLPEEANKWLKDAIDTINAKIYETSLENKKLEGMGTTVVAAICTKSFVVIVHIGDSRAYVLTEDTFQQKTEDHSLVNELRKNGEITKEEAENHPRKNVLTRALGTTPATKSDSVVMEWKEGDGVILCSDGLTNKVTEKEMEEALRHHPSLASCGEALVQLAIDRGGEDNITLAIVMNAPAQKELV